MILEKLIIRNFRNYTHAAIEPCEGINFFIGDNAQGKTNLLESIYIASIGKSRRSARDKELVRWGEKQAQIEATARKSYGTESVLVRIEQSQKTIAVNGMSINKMRDLMGVITTVLFTPDELKIVKGAPSERRRFIDIALCQLSKVYFDNLTRYNRVLDQRNKLLKNSPTDEAIDVWNLQLVEYGSRVIYQRRSFIGRLKEIAAPIHSDISGGEVFDLSYEGIEGGTVREISDNFFAALAKSRARDKHFYVTTVGAQRDDLAITAEGIDLRSFGSQGQQRTAALSLILAEMELLYEQSGEFPVLLLDDVLSELDDSRQNKLLSYITKYQTFITGTKLTANVRDKLNSVTEYKIKNGSIEL